ncbi:MAG: hypothetical protein ABIR50_05195 [Ginsengibacter sp.]
MSFNHGAFYFYKDVKSIMNERILFILDLLSFLKGVIVSLIPNFLKDLACALMPIPLKVQMHGQGSIRIN